jgi:hypothetical protein
MWSKEQEKIYGLSVTVENIKRNGRKRSEERKGVESKIWPKFGHWRFWLVRCRRNKHWIRRRKGNCSILQRSSYKLNWHCENANVSELHVYWQNDDVLLSDIVDTCLNEMKFDLKGERLLSRWETESSSLTVYKCWQTSKVTRVFYRKERGANV